MAKKPPTFGQHALPPAAASWQPIQDLSNLITRDGYLVAGQTTRQVIAARAQTMFPADAARYADWATAHPMMDPRTWQGAAQVGIDPYSDQGKQLAAADQIARTQDGSYDTSVSQVQTGMGPSAPSSPSPTPSGTGVNVSAATLGVGASSPLSGIGDVLGGIGGAAGGLLGTIGSDLATAGRAVQYGLSSGYDALVGLGNVASGQTDEAARLADKYQLSGDEQRLVQRRMNIAGGDTAAAAQDQALDFSSTGMGAVVGSSATFESLTPDRQKIVDQAAKDLYTFSQQQGGTNTVAGIGGAVARQTAAGQIVQDPSLLTNDTGVLASNPQVEERKLAESLKINDMRTPEEIARGVKPVGWTPGRAIAHVWYAPDEQAFQTLSGVIDFTNNLTLDPANLIPVAKGGSVAKKGIEAIQDVGLLGKESGALRRATEVGQAKVDVGTTTGRAVPGAGYAPGGIDAVAAEARSIAAKQAGVETAAKVYDPSVLSETGAIQAGTQSFVAGETAWRFLNSAKGQRLVDNLVNAKSASDIWLRSNRRLDPALAKKLSDANTPEEVRAILGSRLGGDLNDPKALSNFASNAPAIFRDWSTKDSMILQMGRKMPSSGVVNLEDQTQTLTQLERWTRGAGMKWEDVAPHLDNVLTSANGAESYQAIYGKTGLFKAVATHLAEKYGISEQDAAKLTKGYEGGLDAAKRDYLTTEIGLGSVPGSNDDRGIALLMNEIMLSQAPLPHYTEMRRAIQGIKDIRRGNLDGSLATADEKVSKFLDGMTTAWKASVLVRPAYILREVGEMQVASALAGYDSVMTHPGAFISMALQASMNKEATTSAGRLMKAMAGGEMPVAHIDNLKNAGKGVRAAGATVTYRTAQAAGLPLRGAVRVKGVTSRLASNTGDVLAGDRAMKDWLDLRTGFSALSPGDVKWGMVNGEGMFDAMRRLAEGKGTAADLDAMYHGMSAATQGSMSMDAKVGRTASKYIGIAQRDEPAMRNNYITGLIAKLHKAAGDPDMRNIANPDMLPDEVATLFRDSGRRDIKATMHPDLFPTPAHDESYLDIYRQAINIITSGDEKLMGAVTSGKFEGSDLIHTNQALRKHIAAMLDDPGKVSAMPASLPHWKPDYEGGKIAEWVNGFFEHTGEHADLWARGPVYREAYVAEILKYGVELSPAAKADAVKNLRRVGDVALAKKVQAIRANGTMTTDMLHNIGGIAARRELARIFYDAHERGNWAQALRVVSPFIQATANTFRRWGELAMANPQLMYRTTKPLNYAQQPGSAAIYGALGSLPGMGSLGALYNPADYGYSTPDNRHSSVDGFFFTDKFGDKQYAYPTLGLLNNLVGIPEGMLATSPMGGLNVAGQSLSPGVGPLLTLPVALLGQDAINNDDIKGSMLRFALPYGVPKGSLFDKAVGSFVPSSLARLNKASDEGEAVPRLAVQVVPTLLQSGDYDPTNTMDQQRLANDAGSLASRLWMLTAITSLFTPTPVNPKAAVVVKPMDGVGISNSPMFEGASPQNKAHMVLVDKLALEYQRYTANGHYKDGSSNFVHDYGLTALLAVLPSSQTSGPQATNDLWKFRTQAPQSYSNNSDVIGYFFAAGSGFDPNNTGPTGYASSLYSQQKASGERTQKQPDQFVQDGLREFGWMMWNPKVREIELSTMSKSQQAAAKDALKADIIEKTGGAWTDQPNKPSAVVTQIQQVQDALKDPHVSSLRSAHYIQQYMDAREQVVKQIRAQGGVANLSTQQNLPYTQRLVDLGLQLNREDTSGAFNNVWQRLLSKEFGAPSQVIPSQVGVTG